MEFNETECVALLTALAVTRSDYVNSARESDNSATREFWNGEARVIGNLYSRVQVYYNSL